MTRLRPVLAAVVWVTALLGCAGEREADPAPVEIAWREVDLPLPAGAPGRIAVRAGARCAAGWYAVGAVFSGDGRSRPAVWRSRDGRSWESVALRPRGYWARRAVIGSIACRDEQVVLVGAKEGGAHGNPRVTTWRSRADGVLIDVAAPFELYGGPHATSVGDVAAGRGDWLIAGNRTSGAAIWRSEDAATFRLLDTDPALSSDVRVRTLALGQVFAGDRWVVVGSGAERDRIPAVPMAWSSVDARTWVRERVPGGAGFHELQQAVLSEGAVVAAGLSGDRFGLWRRTAAGGWSREGSFASVDQDASGSGAVASLSPAPGGGLLAAVSDGRRHTLWRRSEGAWRRVRTPSTPGAGSERILTAYAGGGQVLLLADDGERGRAWIGRLPEG